MKPKCEIEFVPDPDGAWKPIEPEVIKPGPELKVGDEWYVKFQEDGTELSFVRIDWIGKAVISLGNGHSKEDKWSTYRKISDIEWVEVVK